MSVNNAVVGPYYDVRQFGAVNDGETLCTTAIQHAIDQCHAGGGGIVVVPPGTYLTGTLYLKSFVTLHLTAGATLRGSANRADYNPDDIFPENQVFTAENTTGAHLLIAYDADNVAITGQGRIDGNSAAFFVPLPDEKLVRSYRRKPCNFPIVNWRPSQMVFFCRCRNVKVQDVSLIDAPYWTLFLLGCQTVQIRGVRITNPPQTQNGDGIDIDCCCDVTVSDCIIRSGDDCITLRCNCAPLGECAQPCERIAITNCLLSTPCNGIRVGVGAGTVRHCTFDNIVITDSRRGINMISRYDANSANGSTIEHIAFSNFTIDAIVPLHLIMGHGEGRPAVIRDIAFTNFHMIGGQGCYLGGNPGELISNIHLHNMYVQMTGGAVNPDFGECVPEPYSIYGYDAGLPCALYGRHLEGVQVSHLTVEWQGVYGPWKHALILEDVQHVVLHEVYASPPPVPTAGETMKLTDVTMRQAV